MKTVSLSKTFSASISQGWHMLVDISNYPKFVPFIREITPTGPFREGMVWYDTTNLLWLTQRISHKVELIQKNKRLVFTVPVQGGQVVEDFRLEKVGNRTKITIAVSVSITPWIVEETVGRVLAARFRVMLSGTLENLEKYLLIEK
jgi:hypothetical protein